MIISEEEAIELKTWVVKKLEDISDADSDVLADYVLALIRADTPEPELRLNAIDNLEDFLKDHTATFVDAVFMAIHSRSYMPGYAPPISTSLTSPPLIASARPIGAYGQISTASGFPEGLQQFRKRSYNDRMEDVNGIDPHYGRGDKHVKQVHRGGTRGGRTDTFGERGSRGSQPSANPPGVPQHTSIDYPGMSLPPLGLPFDSYDPVMAMMTMQAMGLPALPGMLTLPQATSPPGYSPFGKHRSPASDLPMKNKVNARCRDYDTKGFCTRGDACPFEHGRDHIVVPGQDEYDPKHSVMLDIKQTSPSTNGHNSFDSLRGNGHIRTFGKGRGDRSGHLPPRRNRAEFSYSGPNHDRSITTIVVEQIPEEKFDEQSVRNFFSEFGKIQSIMMQAYKRLALVQYDDYTGARAAYDSPKVIFDNRFVKVYWYKPNSAPVASKNGPNIAGSSIVESEEQSFDKEKYERDAIAAQKRQEEKKAMLKDTEAKRQALEKQKEELALRQAEEKRKLIEKLTAKGKVGSIRPDPGGELKNGTTKDEKTIDEGNLSAQTKALRAQVAALEAEAKSLGLDTALTEVTWTPRGRGRGRGRGSYRGWEGFAGRGSAFDISRGSPRGRGTFIGSRGGGAYNLDNRTKKVGVSGVIFTSEKDEALRQFLLGVGEFEAIESHPSRTDMQVIIFKDRFTAESFMYGTKEVPSVGKLEFEWVNIPLPAVRSTMKAAVIGGDTGMGGASTDGDNTDKGAMEVDYDVAEEDDRWMVE